MLAPTTSKLTGSASVSGVNPALKELVFLEGEWEVELSETSFLPSPEADRQSAW
jgi:hypothetical protein